MLLTLINYVKKLTLIWPSLKYLYLLYGCHKTTRIQFCMHHRILLYFVCASCTFWVSSLAVVVVYVFEEQLESRVVARAERRAMFIWWKTITTMRHVGLRCARMASYTHTLHVTHYTNEHTFLCVVGRQPVQFLS